MVNIYTESNNVEHGGVTKCRINTMFWMNSKHGFSFCLFNYNEHVYFETFLWNLFILILIYLNLWKCINCISSMHFWLTWIFLLQDNTRRIFSKLPLSFCECWLHWVSRISFRLFLVSILIINWLIYINLCFF